MKPNIQSIGTAVLMTALLAVQAFAGDTPALKTQIDKESYGNGVNIARTLKQRSGEVNLDVLIQGMKDELMGEKLLISEDELRKAPAAYQAEMTQKPRQAAAGHGDETKAKAGGDDAMAANAGPGGGSAIKKEESLARKSGQGGQIAPKKAGISVVERAKVRSEVKKRAAEMRRRAIEQERQGEAPQPGAI